MRKWIDADAVIDEMSEKHRPNFHEDLKSYHMWIMWYWALKNAPTIDIVRCKECKYEPICNHSVQHTTHEPTSVTIGYKSVDFCSYGERKDQ